MLVALVIVLPTLCAFGGWWAGRLSRNWHEVGQVERIVTPHFRGDWVMPKYTWEIRGNGWARTELTYVTEFQARWNVWVAYLATKLKGTSEW